MKETKCSKCGRAIPNPYVTCSCEKRPVTTDKRVDLTKNVKTDEFDLRKGF